MCSNRDTTGSLAPLRGPWRWVRDVALALYAMVGVPMLCLALMLLWCAETLAGRGCALLVLCALPFPVVLMLRRCEPKRRWFRRVMLTLTVGIPLILFLLLACAAPDGRPLANAPVGSVFLDGSYPRWSLVNLVPEIDQVKLGIVLSPCFDALMTGPKSKRLLAAAMPIYREMRARPGYEALGSVLGFSYAEVYGGRYDVGHAYTVVPTHDAAERLPLVVFLHGSGGNMKGYALVWEKLASRLQCAVICPSYGFGNWGAGGTDAVERARVWALANLPVDPSRVYLAGLSNGGIGVCRVAANRPEAYRGLILFCPVIDEVALKSDALVAGWQQKPILCITGEQDERVPRAYVEERLRLVPNAERNVTLQVYDQEDHFLFFTARGQMEEDLAAWFQQTNGIR